MLPQHNYTTKDGLAIVLDTISLCDYYHGLSCKLFFTDSVELLSHGIDNIVTSSPITPN